MGRLGPSGDWVAAVLHVARRIPESALSVMPASGGLQQRRETVCCGLSKAPLGCWVEGRWRWDDVWVGQLLEVLPGRGGEDFTVGEGTSLWHSR